MKGLGLIERRARKRGFVYIACAALVLLSGLWAAEEGIRYGVVYAVILLFLMLQFFRPTILGWLLSLALFATFTVGVLVALVRGSFRGDYILGVLLGLVPTIAIFWARPRPLMQNVPASPALCPPSSRPNDRC
jgi:hypothetical protein